MTKLTTKTDPSVSCPAAALARRAPSHAKDKTFMASPLCELAPTPHAPHRVLRAPLRAAIATALCLSLALGPVAARAQGSAAAAPSKEDMAAAKLHFQEGVKAFQANNYEAAAAAFQKAYDLSKRPDLLYNLAKVAETQGKPDLAIKHLEQYLNERPDAPDRPQVQRDIERLKRQLSPELPVDKTPPKAPDTTPPKTPTPTPDKPSLWQKLPPWPALALMGGGTLFLVTGFGLGGAALSVSKDVQNGATYDRDKDEYGKRLNSAAIAMDVIGAAALGAGIGWTVWWALHRNKAPAPPQAIHLQPHFGAAPGAALVGAQLSF